jgi:amidohydrolase
MDAARAIDAGVERRRAALSELARALHEDPELAYQEHRSVARIAALLASAGVSVEQPFGGLDTAFRARSGDGSAPRVAIVAEYDALPEIGHACGHNLIAAGAVGAFIALHELRAAEAAPAGTVELIGSPAEEGGGGKIRLLDAGAFAGVDAAMMFHPFDRDLLMHPCLASTWLGMTFRGKPSHAALAPTLGTSALTACMDCFRLIDGQRIHMADGARVHGYIKHGGDAANIIVERAECEFSVRAPSGPELERTRAIVERCARAAAMASDVEVAIAERRGYRDMRNNEPLAQRFGAHLGTQGRSPRSTDSTIGSGSTDMGDVSHHVPAIHPWLAICDQGEAICHQRAFAACAVSQRGFDSMLVAAKALALTALDVIHDPGLRRSARAAFDA